jgi:acyl transferase domain-containing protein
LRPGDRSWVIDPADPEHYRQVFDQAGLRHSSSLDGALHCWSLDIPAPERSDQPSREYLDSLGAGSVLHLAQRLVSDQPGRSSRLRVLTRGAQQVNGSKLASPHGSGVWGLASVIAIEHPELGIRVIDLDPRDDQPDGTRLLTELLRGSEQRIAMRGGLRWVPRLERYQRRVEPQIAFENAGPRRVEMERPGSFDNLVLRRVATSPLAPDEVRLRVLATGLNFRDVLTVLGMYPGDTPPLGVECAGIVTEVGGAVDEFRIGQRVFGFAPGSLGTEAVVPAAFLAPVPQGMRA